MPSNPIPDGAKLSDKQLSAIPRCNIWNSDGTLNGWKLREQDRAIADAATAQAVRGTRAKAIEAAAGLVEIAKRSKKRWPSAVDALADWNKWVKNE